MKRYIKQRNNFSCGPTAIINLFTALGKPIPRKYRSRIALWCKCCRHVKGTHPEDFREAVQKAAWEFYKTNSVLVSYEKVMTLSPIDDALDDGLPIVLLYTTKKQSGHYITINNRRGSLYEVTNLNGKSVAKVMRSTLKRFIKSKRSYYPQLFCIV